MGLGGPSQHIAHEERIRAWPRARTASSEYPQTAMVATAPASIAMHLPVHPAISSDPCEKSFQRPSAAGRPDRCFCERSRRDQTCRGDLFPGVPAVGEAIVGARSTARASAQMCVRAAKCANASPCDHWHEARGGPWHPQPAKRILEQLEGEAGRDSNYLPGRSTCRAQSKLRKQSIGSKPRRF
jgi:hypothetical protein